MIVVVRGTEANAVLASDATHSYEEFERDRPFGIVADVADMYRAYDQIRDIAQESRTSVVAGHDPDVMTRFIPTTIGATDSIRQIV